MSAPAAWRRPFLALYGGQAGSLLSSSAVQFAIIWWITATTGSPLALTVASLVGLLPQVLLGPFAGVMVDRFRRTTVMVVADVGVAIASLALGIGFFLGQPPLVFVYVVLFLRAVGEAFHKPALQAAIPQLVPSGDLEKAGGLGQLVTALCSMVGPMLGALLSSSVPMAYIMLVDIAGAAVAVVGVMMVRLPDHAGQTAARTGVFREMRDGFRIILGNRSLVLATIPVFLTGMIFMPLGSLLPLLVKQHFGGDALQAGAVQTLFSLGMLIASLVVGMLGARRRPFSMIALSTFALGVLAVLGGMLPAWAYGIFCAVVFFIGCSGVVGSIPYLAHIQRSVPAESLGKVISTITSFISLGIPIGLSVAGPVSEQLGIGNWMIGAGCLLAFVGIVSHFWLRDLRPPTVSAVDRPPGVE